jgi:hypothetical protein
MKIPLRTLVSAVALLAIVGCSKSYVVTRPLEEPLATPIMIEVGEITDDLPADMEEEKKPTLEDLDKLRRYLEEEIAERELWRLAVDTGDDPNYEVTASLLEYKRGSGVLRFLVGFGAVNARATMTVQLIDRETGSVAFSGNFYGKVSSWSESGDEMFRRIARDFAKELDKQLKNVSGS